MHFTAPAARPAGTVPCPACPCLNHPPLANHYVALICWGPLQAGASHEGAWAQRGAHPCRPGCSLRQGAPPIHLQRLQHLLLCLRVLPATADPPAALPPLPHAAAGSQAAAGRRCAAGLPAVSQAAGSGQAVPCRCAAPPRCCAGACLPAPAPPSKHSELAQPTLTLHSLLLLTHACAGWGRSTAARWRPLSLTRAPGACPASCVCPCLGCVTPTHSWTAGSCETADLQPQQDPAATGLTPPVIESDLLYTH